MKSTSLAMVALLGLSSQVFAQSTPQTTPRFDKQEYRTWSIGINAGLLSPTTVFSGVSRDWRSAREKIGYGGYIKKQILPSLGLQANFLAGKLGGAQALVPTAGSFFDPQTSYNPYSDYETHIEWSGSLTAIYNIANISINHKHGVLTPYVKTGAGYLSSAAYPSGDFPGAARELGETGFHHNWFIPVGAGFKLGITRGVNLDFGYDVNFTRSMIFDGNRTHRNDNFAYGYAGLEFAIGNADKPQLQNYGALANLRTQTKDEAEELRRALSTVEQNAARDRAQYEQDMGDDDKDGVPNKFDKCPNTPEGTKVDGSGCPLEIQKEIVKETKVVVTEEDRRVVREAIDNLEFDLGKSTIRAKSYPTLNRVASLLINRSFSLKLAGHTDNTGSRELNLRLSKERAEAVKAYLASQGVNASRIEATGYGPDQPIATNQTAAGRQQNRRVEFTIY